MNSSNIVAEARASLAAPTASARTAARQTLREHGFTDRQVAEMQRDAFSARVTARFAEATNGSRQVAWYWPVVSVGARHGLSEQDVAGIAVVLSSAALPEDNRTVRLARIKAAAVQALGRGVAEAVVVALDAAHRRQTQVVAERTLCSTDRRYRDRKVGKKGATSLVSEANSGRYLLVHNNTQKIVSVHTSPRERASAYKSHPDRRNLVPGRTYKDVKAGDHYQLREPKSESCGADSGTQTIAGRGKPKGGARKVGEPGGSLSTVREGRYQSVHDAADRFPALAPGDTRIWMAIQDGRLHEDRRLTLDRLHETHAFLASVASDDPAAIYAVLQERKWSPKGEAAALVEARGLPRCSLGVGDVIVTRTGAWLVEKSGFSRLPVSESKPVIGQKDGKNHGYVGFYQNREVDIYASSLYAAKQAAVAHFKPPKSRAHTVHVHLAETPDGKQYKHTADF